MTLLASADDLLARRAVESRAPDLRALGAHLDALIAPALARPLYVPEAKALLSRWGAACRDDEAELIFDPASPRQHRCTKCGHVWSDEQTHRWWVYWYQLWLAERVLVMALRSGDGGNAAAESRAVEALALLLERYQQYPNADNVLGPTRPFFSTYLESIWVLQLATAASTLEALGKLPASLASDLRARLFRPSADIIASFDEGHSNRQVWNATALFALGRHLGDRAMQDAAERGIIGAMEHGLLADGLWYEGENYHWFVLRGLSWGAQLMKQAGATDLWKAERYRAAFTAPVLTALPDFTFPARRDSKFGVSLRQRRMAELWEIGNRESAIGNRDFYPSLLRHVYDPAIPEGADSESAITEVERHEVPSGVRRTKLGWKAWLWMRPELPDADPEAWRPGTTHLEATGLAIFRRDEGKTYVSVDYGEPGGGHGHPDRLHLTTVIDEVPWLLDFGTGSYVAPSLAWYRSTLAHNAPLVDGRSQSQARGRCVAFDERDGHGWICALLDPDTAFDGAAVQRSVIVTPDYVVDVLQMQSDTMDRQIALPWHGLGALVADEDGLLFTRDDGATLRIHLSARQPFKVLVQKAAGPPTLAGAAELEYAVAIAAGESVTLAACLDSRGVVESFDCAEDDFIVRMKDQTFHVHRATDEGWVIEPNQGDPFPLGGMTVEGDTGDIGDTGDKRENVVYPAGHAIDLNRADQYRAAETPYEGPDAFSASASAHVLDDVLHVQVDVVAGEPWFRPADLPDPEWENENPDIHSDGIQVYVDYAGFFGWLIVPDAEGESGLRVSPVAGTDGDREMITGGSWQPTGTGYRLAFDIVFPEPISGDFGFDLYVNRKVEARERRGGQLVWSGARGARLYLAGDRALPGPLPRIRAS